MSKVRVRVARSLKGELTIDPLNHILKANNVIFIDGNDFLSGNVQLAVQKGILLIEYLPDEIKAAVESNLVQLINKSKKNLNLEKSGLSLQAGGSLIIHRNVMKQRDVIEALGSGALDTLDLGEMTVIEPVAEKPKKVLKPSNKNRKTLSDISKPEEEPINVDDFDLEASFLEVQREVLEKQASELKKTETNMSSWNPDGGMIDKNASAEAVMKQQNAETLDVTSGDVEFVDMEKEEEAFVDVDDDAKKRATKKKTSKKKTSKKKKATKKKAKASKKKSSKKKTTKKTIKKKATSKKEDLDRAFVDSAPSDIDFIDDDGLDDITFADEEQTMERIQASKGRIADMNEEIS